MLLGQWDTSLQDINQAIALNPNVGVYYYYRAQYYYNTGNSPAAQQDVNKARQLGFAFNGGLENLRM
jgi:tetratricopeptide (TPR) repeat protein